MLQWIRRGWLSLIMLCGAYAWGALPELPVKSYVLMDAQSGQILAEKNSREKLPPASITKMMTAYLVFDALQQGRLHLHDKVKVSERAYRQQGSRMFIEQNSDIAVHDLLQGLIVQSGNDAGIALAEHIAGSVEDFVARMNSTAQHLNLQDTYYLDPVGLGGDAHVSSARDIAVLSRHLINDFPEYYHYYSQKSYTWNKIEQPNRNRLLFTNPRVDGLKTGHTAAAGYCLSSSEKRGNLRLIAVVLGADHEAERYKASQALLDYGFAQFRETTLLRDTQILKRVRIWKGEKDSLGVRAKDTVQRWLPLQAPNTVNARVSISSPLVAPIAAGDKIGTITLHQDGQTIASVDALAAESVAAGGFFRRSWDGFKLIFTD